MNRKEAEHKIIAFTLAAFHYCKEYAPKSNALTMRVFWDEDDKMFRLNAYNDAYTSDALPIEIHGHFSSLEDIEGQVRRAEDENVNVQYVAHSEKVAELKTPVLYDRDEILDIFDESVLRMIAQLEKGQHIARSHLTATKLCLAAFKEQLRNDLREDEQ